MLSSHVDTNAESGGVYSVRKRGMFKPQLQLSHTSTCASCPTATSVLTDVGELPDTPLPSQLAPSR